MFALNTPLLELVARGVFVYVALLVLVRVSGKRTVGQFTPFDLLVVMLLSEAVSNSLTAGDESVLAGLVVAAVLIALSALAGFLSSRSKTAERLLDGEPVLIARDGKVLTKTLRGHRLSRGEFDESLRENDCELHDVAQAYLEADGSISVLKKPGK